MDTRVKALIDFFERSTEVQPAVSYDIRAEDPPRYTFVRDFEIAPPA